MREDTAERRGSHAVVTSETRLLCSGKTQEVASSSCGVVEESFECAAARVELLGSPGAT